MMMILEQIKRERF